MREPFPRVVSRSEMAAVDRSTIDNYGVSGAELMERAGRRVVETIQRRWEGLEGLDVAVVCGKGNNGGDGFVVARLLAESGVAVQVLATASRSALSADAEHHFGLLEAAGIGVSSLDDDSASQLGKVDLIVDALLGTGLTGGVRAEQASAIEAINSAGPPILAIDLPSGLDADTGRADGVCVRAALTVTFGLPKIGQMFFPGRSYCGALELVDIGFAPQAVAACKTTTYLLTRTGIGRLVPERSPVAHKGSCGSAFVVAGSVGMTGAAALTADSALRVGAGRASLGIPASLNDILEIKLTEVMTRPLPEVRGRRCLSLRARGELERAAVEADCVAIGPGLGTYRETSELVRRVVDSLAIPMVIDADGLNAFAGHTDILKDRANALVLTPHLGEFTRIADVDMADVVAEPLKHARNLAQTLSLTVVLKGAPTLVALADGGVYVSPTGNAGMATAGSGDVLTGTIAGLICQGLEAAEAACVGVFVHGLAGDLARERCGQWGMKASDVKEHLPEAVLSVWNARNEET